MRELITFECSVCRRRNYNSTKDKKKSQKKIELKKFCRFCRKHTVHKEIK